MSSVPARAVPEPTPIRPDAEWERPSSLPLVSTSFVGREQETAALIDLLSQPETRLVTLIGPGGVGKTRLAVRVAEQIGRVNRESNWFVSLAALQDPALVAGLVAEVIEAPKAGAQVAEEQVLAALRSARGLLVLDNLEHLPGAVGLIARITRECSQLRILATSRSMLGLPEERVFAVLPLPMPDAIGKYEDSVRSPGAIQLFWDRARAANPALAETPEAILSAAAICRRLDGLPLAIELAAAWSGVLPLKALHDRLSPRLALLTGGSPHAHERNRTMRDSIQWSYELLSPDEQAVFRRIGVFVGGCSLEAAEEAAVIAPIEGEILMHLRALVEKSLIQPAPVADVPRFTMLETIREFALSQLMGMGEEEAARAAHAAWCVRFAERWEKEITTPSQVTWLPWSEAEIDNVRAALVWLRAQGDTRSAMRMIGSLAWYWQYPGRYHEGLAHIQSVLAMPGADQETSLYAGLLLSAGSTANWLHDLEAARSWYGRAQRIGEESGDTRTVAFALAGLGNIALEERDLEGAELLFTESLTQCRAVGEGWYATWVTNKLGATAFARGDYEAAFDLHSRALAEWRAAGDLGHVMSGLEPVGRLALFRGDPGSARAAFAEMLEMAIEDDPWSAALAIRGLAAVSEADGDPQGAFLLMAAAEQWLDREGTRLQPQAEAAYDEIRARIEAALGPAGYAAERERGLALTSEQAIDRARAVAAGQIPESASEFDALAEAFGLTRREGEVLRLIAEGLTDQEIAARLFISRRTASKHVEAILGKLGVDSRRAAALTLRTDAGEPGSNAGWQKG
jgi:predicted ATPase/DNA-binding CsgD family transcriptional regulator